MAERLVRFSPQFFEHLDVLFPEERSADGTPSRTDFLLYELPRVRDQLANDFEGNTALIDDGPARVWIGGGALVAAIAVYAYLADDDNIDVIGLFVGLHPSAPEDDDDPFGDR